MGRVRTKTIKRTARQIIEKYYNRLTDFNINSLLSMRLLPVNQACATRLLDI